MEEKTVKNDKKDALLADAIKQIEKQYGKGSIMKLGERAAVDVDAISSGSIKIDEALASAATRKGGSSRSTDQSPAVRRRWRCMRSPKCRKKADARPISTRKTPSIPIMRKIWA